ncbi:PLP-dependent aminotransferase family protein [Bacillaceae bacterium Marseille-Q3522]|nr:PLP-dependent aminotransferase family protein [Bacillaceae bacterium Marseille-Q3522]
MIEINWQPDINSAVPLYEQIYHFVKRKIINGEWAIGTKLPPQRKLALYFHVNRSTVVYALEELTAEGFLAAKVGQGTFVANNTWSRFASNPPPDWHNYVNAGSHYPNMKAIQKINLAETKHNMIRLGTGELAPELLPSKEIKQLFQKKRAEFSLSYSEPKGNIFLREEISRHLNEKGIHVSPSSILIISGGLQGLQLISLGLLQRGSTIFHETPSYLHSVQVFQSSGMHLLGIPLETDGIQTERIAMLKRQHHAALLYTIPTFHNPTGIVMTEQKRRELISVCNKERLPIIEDDAYGDLWFEEAPPLPLKALDNNGLVLYLGSWSKTVAPGLRIGWVAGSEAVIDRLADIKMQTDYGTSALSQYAAAEWLAGGYYEEHIKKIRAALKHRRDVTLSFLHKHFREIASWNVPKGGFYIWLQLQKQISIYKLFEKAMQEGILLNPGYIYDRNAQQHLRISYSYASPDELENGLRKLRILVEEMTDKY